MARKVYVFIDAAQLREGLAELGVEWQDLNLQDLANVLIGRMGETWLGEPFGLARVFVYDAINEPGEPSETERWLARNEELPDVHFRRGRPAWETRRRQKAVDVQLAVDSPAFVTSDAYDAALLMSGDADFTPVVEAIRDRGLLVVVCSPEKKLSPLLSQAADRIVLLPDEPEAYEGWSLPKLP